MLSRCPLLFLFLGGAASLAHAQFSFVEVDATARVETSAVDSQTFESFLEEDERTRTSPGLLEGMIGVVSGANSGVARANAEYDLNIEAEGIRFTADLESQVSLGGALTINATSGASIAGVLSPLGQTDVSLLGSFVLDQPLPTGFAGPAVVDIRAQLLGASASQPTMFVNLQFDLSSLTPGSDNEIRFIDTATLFPDGEYSLIVSASLITGIQPGGVVSTSELSGRFTARLDFRDTDGDGLFDTWEEDGIDFDMDGVPELDLPAEGASVSRKDLFVEMDVHQSGFLTQQILDTIAASFDNAPVSNTGGTDGIALHIDIDEADLPDRNYEQNYVTGQGNVRLQMRDQREMFFGSSAQRSSQIADALIQAKSLVYRYGVIGGTQTYIISEDPPGSPSERRPGDPSVIRPGGFAELPGDDFIITLRNASTRPNDLARTIMHELGHTLGLRHGGGDNVNFKPNYFSVMNYMHALKRTAWGARWNDQLMLDYSRSKLSDLDEALLSESTGIGSTCACTQGRLFAFANRSPINPSGDTEVWIGRADPQAMVDFDIDGSFDTTGFQLDLNRINPKRDENIEVHTGHNDWDNIYYKVRGERNFDFLSIATGESTLDPEIGEISDELNDLIDALPVIFLDDDATPCTADITMDGNLNFFDVVQFIGLYNAQDPAADLAAPFGAWNFFDIAEYIALFNAGCP